MAGIRMHIKNTVHFITNRCEQEQLLMLPSEKINEIILAWLVRALVMFGEGIEVYGFIILSNHFHLLLRDTMGNLAQFMCYFQANVAKAVNKELGRHGKFWAREYDDMIVDGEAEFLDRYAYVLCNAVKAGLVDKASEWIGLSSLGHALSGKLYRVKMFNATKYHKATRRGQKKDRSEFMEEYEYGLVVPPMWEGKSQAEIKELTEELVNGGEAKYRAERGHRPALGVAKIRAQSPFDRPQDPSFRPRIKFFTFCKERRKELLEAYRRFVGVYRETWDAFNKAAHLGRRPMVEWPSGSYPPSCWLPVSVARAA